MKAYNYKLTYMPGKQIPHADGLSHMPVAVLEKKIPDPRDILFLESLDAPLLTVQTIAQLSSKNSVLCQVLQWVLRGWPSSKPDSQYEAYFHRCEEL